jgi:hypothetical protein
MLINDTTRFTMGTVVRCTDGGCGALRRVVVDPVARTLTHLVVEPGHRERDGHLVPVGLVSSTGVGGAGVGIGAKEFRRTALRGEG